MKEKNEEKLFALLGGIEQSTVENAIRVDSPEALAAYKKKKTRTHPFASPVLRRVTAIAAAFALVVSSLFVLPRLLTGKDYAGAPPPPSFAIVAPDNIKSIDMLNYYAALLTLSGRWGRAYDKAVAFTEISALSDGISESATPTSSRKDDTVLYALDPDDVFRVTSIVFFRIRLEDPKGFLASRVGTGVVDVVITENSLEPMITFKNGDRYYSCLINGLSEDSADFSAHKYIEGFHIVKNLALENNKFMVSFEGKSTDAASWKVKSVNVICYGDGNYSDGTLPVIGDTETYKGTLFFTVRDLEDYFASVDMPDAPSESLATREYSDGSYSFLLVSDGSFTYSSSDPSANAFRTGRYEEREGEIVLDFMMGETVVAHIVCPKTASGGFLYADTEFAAKEK